MSLHLDQLIHESIKRFNSCKRIDSRLSNINLVIELMKKDDRYHLLLYKYIKIWMKYYLLSSQKKTFSYDDIVFDKVMKKISYLKSTNEKLQILSYFIRLLQRYNFQEEIFKYSDYRKKLQLTSAFHEKKIFSVFLKFITYNLYTLFSVILVSLAFFTGILYNLEQHYNEFNIFSIFYIDNHFLNISANLVAYLFNINKTIEFHSICVLSFMLLIKIYFYIVVTYFVVEEISKKVERI